MQPVISASSVTPGGNDHTGNHPSARTMRPVIPSRDVVPGLLVDGATVEANGQRDEHCQDHARVEQ
jgi:hypothetical protein